MSQEEIFEILSKIHKNPASWLSNLALMLMASLVRQRRESHPSLATLSLLFLILWIGITLAACGGEGPSTTTTQGTPPVLTRSPCREPPPLVRPR